MALIYQQRRLNIFFIDWEQPRKNFNPIAYDSPHTSLKKSYGEKFYQENLNSTRRISETISNGHDTTQSSRINTPRESVSQDYQQNQETVEVDTKCSINEHDFSVNWSVSVWRTYFIANEWLRIKIKRKTDILLQMVTTIFILEVRW